MEIRSFFNRHRSRPHLVHWNHPGPLLYELMKDPSSREVNLWLQLLIQRPQTRYEKTPHTVFDCLLGCLLSLHLLDWDMLSNARLKWQGQKCFLLGLLKRSPMSILLSHSLFSHYTFALSPLNKSLIPKNTACSLPAISRSLSQALSPTPSFSFLLHSCPFLNSCSAFIMLRSLSPCLAFHSNPPMAFHMHNIPPWAPIPLTGFHILD